MDYCGKNYETNHDDGSSRESNGQLEKYKATQVGMPIHKATHKSFIFFGRDIHFHY